MSNNDSNIDINFNNELLKYHLLMFQYMQSRNQGPKITSIMYNNNCNNNNNVNTNITGNKRKIQYDTNNKRMKY